MLRSPDAAPLWPSLVSWTGGARVQMDWVWLQRSRKLQPRMSPTSEGTTPGMAPSSAAGHRAARHRNAGDQAARVGMLRGGEERRRGPSSTIWPAYITATRSAIRATMPRSWVISTHRHAELALQIGQQPQDLRLDRHVERRGRLVGDQQRRARTSAPSRS